MRQLTFQVHINRVLGNRHVSYRLRIVWEDGFTHDEDIKIMDEYMHLRQRILWDTINFHLKSRENVIGQN